MDMRTKEEFQHFMCRAMDSFTQGTNTDDCYIELYNILLRCFISADVDSDGQIGLEEFPCMVEQAAQLPRKFGYHWWGEEGCSGEEERLQAATKLFNKIDENGDGAVSFEEWLAAALSNYQQLVASSLPPNLISMDKEAFLAVLRGAAASDAASQRCLYFFHWQCFQAADSDRDGMVSQQEFSKMLEMATQAQKRLSLWVAYPSPEDKAAAFAAVDENGDGSVSFDEWLNFANQEILAKVAA